MQEKTRTRPTWRQILAVLTMRCPHWELSAPLTIDSETFRVCIACGARRRFNLNTWEAEGGFYFPIHYGRENSEHTNLSK
jgi:hypothetical protein